MRVLVAHFRPDAVSGAELALADFIEKRDPRFHYTMLVPGEGPLAAFYRQKGWEVWVKTVQNHRRIAPGLHTLQSLLLARALRRRGFHLVLCNTFAASSRVMTAARFAGLPTAIYVREYIQDKPPHRALLARADRILVVSADLQQHLAAFAGPGPVCLAYDTIDARPVMARLSAHRASAHRTLPFEPGAPVVGLVGRIARFKQQDLFIRAIPSVLNEMPQARFVVVGSALESEKEYERSIRQLADRLGLQDRVHFLGYRQDNVELMSELSILCLTSTREPLGRVILEAHLAGTPVVASDTGGPGEIVEDGVTGLLFPPAGPGAAALLAEKILCLLKDPGLGRTLAAQAAERIWETYAGPEHVRQIEAYLDELVLQAPR
jgi:glycosyltransferase involved in cell wall biosynthesis